MLDKKNLVSTLITQHRTLQKEVGAVAEILESASIDSQKIVDGLSQFSKDLAEHLKTENEVFYVELLKNMKAKGQNTSKTEEFINEMKEIEKVIIAFLEKYNKASSIDNNLDEFKKEFFVISETLTLRIESEEAGVYSYWG